MKIQTARLVIADRSYLELTTDQGIACLEAPKEIFRRQRFVVLTGDDVASGKVETETGYLPVDPSDGRWVPLEIPYTTSDIVAVALGHRLVTGQLQPGPVIVPTPEEADAETLD